jgi:hypothetical protein
MPTREIAEREAKLLSIREKYLLLNDRVHKSWPNPNYGDVEELSLAADEVLQTMQALDDAFDDELKAIQKKMGRS